MWRTKSKLIELIAKLNKEVGKVSKAALEAHFNQIFWHTERLKDYKNELIQVVEFAVVMLESLERNNKQN